MLLLLHQIIALTKNCHSCWKNSELASLQWWGDITTEKSTRKDLFIHNFLTANHAAAWGISSWNCFLCLLCKSVNHSAIFRVRCELDNVTILLTKFQWNQIGVNRIGREKCFPGTEEGWNNTLIDWLGWMYTQSHNSIYVMQETPLDQWLDLLLSIDGMIYFEMCFYQSIGNLMEGLTKKTEDWRSLASSLTDLKTGQGVHTLNCCFVSNFRIETRITKFFELHCHLTQPWMSPALWHLMVTAFSTEIDLTVGLPWG